MSIVSEDSAYDGSGKSPAEIERDIGETRAELGAVLDALEHRLAPRQLLEKSMSTLRDTMNGNGGMIGDALRGNPVPVALIGAGVGWLLIASAAGDRPARLARRVGGTLSDAARQAGGKARDLAGSVMEEADSAAAPDQSYAAGEEMAGYAYARTKPRIAAAAETAGRARAGVARAFEDHPLALGMLGMLAGAALALVLPRSREAVERAGENQEPRPTGEREGPA